MLSLKRDSNNRCEPWCRYWFRLEGETSCTFGPEHITTEKGAPCMGRKERVTEKSLKDYTVVPGGEIVKKKWDRKPDDPYCRRECEFFDEGVCHYGLEPCATEDGARCMGKKRVPRNPKNSFE